MLKWLRRILFGNKMVDIGRVGTDTDEDWGGRYAP